MTTPFLAALAGPDGIRQIQRIDGPLWEFRQPGGEAYDLTDEDLRFLATLAPAILATLDRAERTHPAPSRPAPAPQPPTTSPPRTGKPWSDAEDQRLANTLATGASVPAIAEAFQRTPGAILARLLHLDLVTVAPKCRPPTPEGT
ncbi:MAG: hypothetical protein O9289_18245 [Rhodobacteraceae bacterium]|nr:hypothetical protein [Paracoccaceae bacterium]